MASEYGLEILNKVQKEFARLFANDKQIKKLTKEIATSTSYENANLYAIRTGELLSKALTKYVNDDELSYISKELAEDILRPTLTTSYEIVANAAKQVQLNQNIASKIGLQPQVAEIDNSRIDGLISKISSYDTMSEGNWVLKEPVINYNQAVVDYTAKKNMNTLTKVGMEPTITRKAENGACRWCRSLEGTYKYIEFKDTGNNVYRRHERCRCLVTYENGKKRQNVWDKTEWEVEEKKERKAAIEKAIEEKEKELQKEQEYSPIEKAVLENAKAYNIQYNQVAELTKPLTSDEIINKVGGGDLTKGSCVSSSWAYIGNKCGYDVLDFRGGQSWNYFATRQTSLRIKDFEGVNSFITSDKNAIKAAIDVLQNAQENKEYLLIAGEHGAIVKKAAGKMYYLELQSATDNGFKPLSQDVLRNRFFCKKSRTLFGTKIDQEAMLMDVESFSNSEAFKEMLGYINTAEKEQKKGIYGQIR